jgi:hypothetical protein
LAGRVEIVAAEEEAEAEFLRVVEGLCIVAVYVVAAIAERALERAIGIGAFVSQIGVDVLRGRAPGEEPAAGVEVAALQTRGELIGQRFALADVDDAEAAEVAIFRAEGAVDDGDVLDEFGAERF